MTFPRLREAPRRRLRLAVALALSTSLIAPAGAQELPPEAAALLGGSAAAARAQAAGAGAGAAGAIAVPGRGVETLRSADPPRPDPRSLGTCEGCAPTERLPRPEPTDFQLFAATSVGSTLPIFGLDLFQAWPSTFAPVDGLPATADYLLGPGDELVIRGWGQVEVDVRAVVSRDGSIAIPRVGVVPVGGVRFQDLHGHLKAAVGKLYRNFDLSVSMGRLRSIQVFVLGQARRPGLYTVGSLSTLVNALFASAGPAPTGSMRRIQLRRGDKVVGEIDLYDLLLRGDKSKDLRLQAGDVIFIPPAGPMAAVAGRVKVPALYELKDPAPSLGDLVGYAGGPTTTAATRSLSLERLDPARGRVAQELPWGEAALSIPLRDGDVVQVRPISQRFDNAVTLRGSVALPTRTEWRKGLTVADLIPDPTVLIPEAYWERAASRAHEAPKGYWERVAAREKVKEDRRAREEQLALLRGDPTKAGTEKAEPDLGPAGEKKALGAVLGPNAPSELEGHQRTSVDMILEEVNWDYAVVERLDRATLEPRLLPFHLKKAVIDRDPAQNLALEPGDVVTVFSQRDILAPAEKRTYYVRVEGEVQSPGVYQVRPGETLRQLVARAGGLTRNAYLFGAEFTREGLRREQQARLEEVANRAEKELDSAASERLARATVEDAAATRTQLETQRAAIVRMRALKATGRMVLEVDTEATAATALPDIVLEDGDRLLVPHRGSTVSVYGSVYNQTSFVHRPGKTIGDYLDQAGGPTRQADSGSTYVLRADGSVFSRRQSGWLSSFGGRTLMPNDAIVVPEDYAPISWVKELRDWSQIFYQFGLGVAAIKVLIP